MSGDQLSIWGDGAPTETKAAAARPDGACLPADEAVRQRIITEVDRSCLVEASAGTGKTRLLVNRILHIVGSGAGRLPNLVAITFTEKAASELRTKVRMGIQSAVRNPQLAPEERARFEAGLAEFDRATVATIHAFCTQLLRARPVEAGVSPGFQLTSRIESQLLLDEAWNAWKERELSSPDSPLRPVLEAGGKLQYLKSLAGVLVENRDLLDTACAGDLLKGPLPEWEAAFQAYRETLADSTLDAMERLLADCRKPVDDNACREVTAALPGLRRAARRIRDADSRAPLHALRPSGLPNAYKLGNQTHWKPKESLLRLRALMTDINVACDRYTRTRKARVAVEAVRSLCGLLEIYDRLKSERGQLDFQDLLIRARDLLRDHPEVRGDFQAGISHLLVDEFQDTDPLQAEIVFFLSGDLPPAEKNWEQVRVTPGRLFLVGDPKQSIYRFRRADIGIYERARRRLVASGGDVHPITVNFRTRPGVTEWINTVFGRLMPVEGSGEFRPVYSTLEPYRAEDPGESGPRVIRLPLPEAPKARSKWKPRTREEDEPRRRVEARSLASYVKSQIEAGAWRVPAAGGEKELAPAGYGDVAVLFRALTGLESFEDAFRDAGVPYRIEGGKYYFQRREVQALLSVLRAIDSPNDREALVAALRSPLFGFDDETIVIAAAERRLSYGFRSRPSNGELAAAFDTLRGWHERRHVEGPERIVEEVLRETKALEFFAMQPLGEQRVANLLKVVDEARRYGGEPGSYRSFIDHLSRREAAFESEGESPVLEEDEAGYVHFITVHKAKGLEFPIVVVADLMGGVDSQGEMRFDRTSERIAFRLKSVREGPGDTPGWEDLEAIEKAQAEAEEIRLFYVAVTRAREYLVLPLPESGSAKGSFYALLNREEWPAAADVSPDAPIAGDLFPRRTVTPEDLVTTPESDTLDGARREFAVRRAALLDGLPMASRIVSPSLLKTGPIGSAALPPGASRRDSSRARALGQLVHAVLQRGDLGGRDHREWIDRLLPHHPPLGEADRGDVSRLLGAASGHPVMASLRSARRVLREVPFSCRHAEGVYVDGLVDLLVETAEGLTVVDFKSDRIGRDGVDALFQRYRGQALAYALGVTRSSGLPVREVVFLFLDAGLARSFAVDDAVLAEAAGLVEGLGTPPA